MLRFELPVAEHRALEALLDAAERGELPFIGAFEQTHGEATVARLRHAQLARTSGLHLRPTGLGWEVGRPARLHALLDLLDSLRAQLRSGSIRAGEAIANPSAAELVRAVGATGPVDVTLDASGAPAAIVPRVALLDFRRDGFVVPVPFSVDALPTLYAFGQRHFVGLTSSPHPYALRNVELRECTFAACAFTGLYLDGAAFDACRFEGCSFATSTLQRVRFAACEFVGGRIDAAVFVDVDADGSTFSEDLAPALSAILQSLAYRSLRLGDTDLVRDRITVRADAHACELRFDGTLLPGATTDPSRAFAYVVSHPHRDLHPLEVVAGAKLMCVPDLHARLIEADLAGGWPHDAPPTAERIHEVLTEAGVDASKADVARLCGTLPARAHLAGAARYIALTRALQLHRCERDPHDLDVPLQAELTAALRDQRISALPLHKASTADKLRRRVVEGLNGYLKRLPHEAYEYLERTFKRTPLMRYAPDHAP